MYKEKLNQLLDNYSEHLKKYGVYLLLILFIFTLTLSFMLNRIKPAADISIAEEPLTAGENSLNTNNESPNVNNDPPVTNHQSSVTEQKTPVTKNESPATESKPPVTKKNPPVTNHQSPVTNLTWPIRGTVLTNYELAYSQIYDDYRLHPGIDISTNPGDYVTAAADGKVVSVVSNSGERIAIEIEHGKGWTTYYSHLTQALVKEGESVKAGQKIGQAGAPGTEESDLGSHLHFQLKEQNQWVDPLKYLKE
ncbi:MAG: M23 family metallopeptidase [Bacillota bacterium]